MAQSPRRESRPAKRKAPMEESSDASSDATGRSSSDGSGFGSPPTKKTRLLIMGIPEKLHAYTWLYENCNALTAANRVKIILFITKGARITEPRSDGTGHLMTEDILLSKTYEKDRNDESVTVMCERICRLCYTDKQWKVVFRKTRAAANTSAAAAVSAVVNTPTPKITFPLLPPLPFLAPSLSLTGFPQMIGTPAMAVKPPPLPPISRQRLLSKSDEKENVLITKTNPPLRDPREINARLSDPFKRYMACLESKCIRESKKCVLMARADRFFSTKAQKMSQRLELADPQYLGTAIMTQEQQKLSEKEKAQMKQYLQLSKMLISQKCFRKMHEITEKFDAIGEVCSSNKAKAKKKGDNSDSDSDDDDDDDLDGDESCRVLVEADASKYMAILQIYLKEARKYFRTKEWPLMFNTMFGVLVAVRSESHWYCVKENKRAILTLLDEIGLRWRQVLKQTANNCGIDEWCLKEVRMQLEIFRQDCKSVNGDLLFWINPRDRSTNKE